MNDLEKYFRENNKRLIEKWIHYFDIYDLYFSKFRNKEVTILEIGVSQGGSLQMWKKYFGEGAKIYGIDIHPECKELEEENIKIFIGSQSDRTFLRKIKQSTPKIDILIDDGGHTMNMQIVTFEELFDHIKDDGIYLCEDLHSSYHIRFGGGHKRNGTFIEYSKNFIDFLNAYFSEQKSLKVNSFTKSVNAIHYYDSVIVIEKRKREKPISEKTGIVSFPEFNIQPTHNKIETLIRKVGFYMIYKINQFLRFFKFGSFFWK